ncbi:hypothetical protein, partial [Streptomyces decoyicus]|uniref:hypothetical protein n=1 Tax=Streptomyces decoyicus TaxID=249567 RepID=UPI0033A5F284
MVHAQHVGPDPGERLLGVRARRDVTGGRAVTAWLNRSSQGMLHEDRAKIASPLIASLGDG